MLSIQSHVVRGYVGNRAATFPLQVRLRNAAVSPRPAVRARGGVAAARLRDLGQATRAAPRPPSGARAGRGGRGRQALGGGGVALEPLRMDGMGQGWEHRLRMKPGCLSCAHLPAPAPSRRRDPGAKKERRRDPRSRERGPG